MPFEGSWGDSLIRNCGRKDMPSFPLTSPPATHPRLHLPAGSGLESPKPDPGPAPALGTVDAGVPVQSMSSRPPAATCCRSTVSGTGGRGFQSRQFISTGGNRHEVGVEMQRKREVVARGEGPAVVFDLDGKVAGDRVQPLEADGGAGRWPVC
jgi:hypothetical protein